MKLLTLIIICIVIYLLFISLGAGINQKFDYLSIDNEPSFLSKEETIKFFKDDKDNYINDLTKYDIMSLNASSKDEYLIKSINAASDFTNSEKNKLREATRLSDEYFLKMKDIPFIDKHKLATMKWNLSKTVGRDYEGGYPHTREDVIFVPNEILNFPMKELIRTMIHEKVHVYERLYHDDFTQWAKFNGYKPYKKFNDYELRRSNPDLDGIVYLDNTGKETLAIFNTLNPNSIDDSSYPQPGKFGYMAESPIETLAYYIDHDYANEKFPYEYLIDNTVEYKNNNYRR